MSWIPNAEWIEVLITPALAHMIGDMVVGISIFLLVRVGCQMMLPIIGYGCYQAFFTTQRWRHWKSSLRTHAQKPDPTVVEASDTGHRTEPEPAKPVAPPQRVAVSVSAIATCLFFIANFSAFLVQPINSLIKVESICQVGDKHVNESFKFLGAGADWITGEWGSVIANAGMFLGASCANLTNVRADSRLRTMCTQKPSEWMPDGNVKLDTATDPANIKSSSVNTWVDVDQVGVAVSLRTFLDPEKYKNGFPYSTNASTALVSGLFCAPRGANDTTTVFAGATQTLFETSSDANHSVYPNMLMHLYFLAIHAQTTFTARNATFDSDRQYLVTIQKNVREARIYVHTKPGLINITTSGTLSRIDSEAAVFRTDISNIIDTGRTEEPSDFRAEQEINLCRYSQNVEVNVTDPKVFLKPGIGHFLDEVQAEILECTTGLYILGPQLGIVRVQGNIAARLDQSYQLWAKYYASSPNFATSAWLPGPFPTQLPYTLGDHDGSRKLLQTWAAFAITVVALWLVTKLTLSVARREAFLISASAMQGLCAGVAPPQVWMRYEPMIEVVDKHGRAEFRFAEHGETSFGLRDVAQKLVRWGNNGWMVSGWSKTE
ncbi:hypothetical protein HDU96_000037 [Phlyctochytrium bullatum]|nr:hypothetical protein HDU96_000037 [Phlyctochytrium bullatum]